MKKLVLGLIMATSIIGFAQADPPSPAICYGTLLGPGSEVDKFGGILGSEWAMISPEKGLEGCHIRTKTYLWNRIISKCSINQKCMVVGKVKSVRNDGENAFGASVDVIVSISKVSNKFEGSWLPADW